MHHQKSQEIMEILRQLPGIHSCRLYGSLADGTGDRFSDIDIELDVSGCDNGKFLLTLPVLLRQKMEIVYADYAPSLAPDKYVVSLAIDRENPFLLLDLQCTATPHCTSVTKQLLSAQNNEVTHTLKLWTANLKHFLRGNDCQADILRMAQKIPIEAAESKSPQMLLNETLCWLEAHFDQPDFLSACRRAVPFS